MFLVEIEWYDGPSKGGDFPRVNHAIEECKRLWTGDKRFGGPTMSQGSLIETLISCENHMFLAFSLGGYRLGDAKKDIPLQLIIPIPSSGMTEVDAPWKNKIFTNTKSK
jgi:hypothetical protein